MTALVSNPAALAPLDKIDGDEAERLDGYKRTVEQMARGEVIDENDVRSALAFARKTTEVCRIDVAAISQRLTAAKTLATSNEAADRELEAKADATYKALEKLRADFLMEEKRLDKEFETLRGQLNNLRSSRRREVEAALSTLHGTCSGSLQAAIGSKRWQIRDAEERKLAGVSPNGIRGVAPLANTYRRELAALELLVCHPTLGFWWDEYNGAAGQDDS